MRLQPFYCVTSTHMLPLSGVTECYNSDLKPVSELLGLCIIFSLTTHVRALKGVGEYLSAVDGGCVVLPCSNGLPGQRYTGAGSTRCAVCGVSLCISSEQTAFLFFGEWVLWTQCTLDYCQCVGECYWGLPNRHVQCTEKW